MNFQRMFLVAVLYLVIVNGARAQHGDLELFDDAGQVAVEPRLAEGEFGEAPNLAYRADEPGLKSDPDELIADGETPLPGGALVGFNTASFTLEGLTRGLFYWNGVGNPDFVSLAAPHQLNIWDPTESIAIRLSPQGLGVGFNFALTADGSGPDPAGFLHSHLKFDLVDPTGVGVGSPAAGVYAFATTFSVTGLQDSDPVYWVLASGVDESIHQAAVDYISERVSLVPEPGALILAACSSALGILRWTRLREI